MGWQTQSVVQLFAGNTIINPAGAFTYSGNPGAGNLIASMAPTSGTDSFENHYLSGVASYGSSFASQLGIGFLNFYTGSLASGWTAGAVVSTDSFGDLILQGASGRSVITTNNTLDDGSGNMAISGSLTVGGSSTTGSGNNGGVTSGPSGTVSSFPAAGPNHTHAEIHQHPF